MTTYSITPEGAKSAARELRISTHNLDGERGTSTSPDNPANKKWLDSVVEGDAAIILRHAEQSQSRMQLAQKIVGRVLGELYRLGQGSHVVDVTARNILDAAVEAELASSEGEMRTGMKTPWCLNGHEVLTPGCESCLLDLQKRYNDALRKVQGEGEMREALLAYEEAERHMRVGLCDTDCAKATKLLTAAHELAQKALGPAGREEKP